MHCGVFNVPCQLGAAEVGQAAVDDHYRYGHPVTSELFCDGLPAEEGQYQRSRKRCSDWLQLQAGMSNRPPVKKNHRFPQFFARALPLRCGGLGDEWH